MNKINFNIKNIIKFYLNILKIIIVKNLVKYKIKSI